MENWKNRGRERGGETLVRRGGPKNGPLMREKVERLIESQIAA